MVDPHTLEWSLALGAALVLLPLPLLPLAGCTGAVVVVEVFICSHKQALAGVSVIAGNRVPQWGAARSLNLVQRTAWSSACRALIFRV